MRNHNRPAILRQGKLRRASCQNRAVLNQATERCGPRLCFRHSQDIESQPIQSAAFAEAVAFFTRSGAWAEARTMIGDFLELHRDELELIGRRCIDARHARDKLAAETLRRSTDMRYDSPLHLARLVARRRSARPRAFPYTRASDDAASVTAKPVSRPTDTEPPPASRADKPIGLRFIQIKQRSCPYGMDQGASPESLHRLLPSLAKWPCPTATFQRRGDAISEFLFLKLPHCLAAAFRPAEPQARRMVSRPPHPRARSRCTAKSGSIVGSRHRTTRRLRLAREGQARRQRGRIAHRASGGAPKL